jgi:hypothetical protein
VSDRSAALLEPLGKFVLEVLPWALSSLIVLYLIWGTWFAPQPMPAGTKPLATHSTATLAVNLQASRAM